VHLFLVTDMESERCRKSLHPSQRNLRFSLVCVPATDGSLRRCIAHALSVFAARGTRMLASACATCPICHITLGVALRRFTRVALVVKPRSLVSAPTLCAGPSIFSWLFRFSPCRPLPPPPFALSVRLAGACNDHDEVDA